MSAKAPPCRFRNLSRFHTVKVGWGLVARSNPEPLSDRRPAPSDSPRAAVPACGPWDSHTRVADHINQVLIWNINRHRTTGRWEYVVLVEGLVREEGVVEN